MSTTTVTVNDMIHSEIIKDAALEMSRDWVGISPHLLEESLVGRSSATHQWWKPQNASGAVATGGAGVDTEFDGPGENAELSETAFATDGVTSGVATYGILRLVSDESLEDGVAGNNLLSIIANDGARILVEAYEDDVFALFASFTNTVGTTATPMSIANMSSCLVGLRDRGVRAPNGVVFWHTKTQASDYEGLIASTSASQAVYATAADRFLKMDGAASLGLADGAYAFFRGQPCHQSGLTDDDATDGTGACFVPAGGANDPWAALGSVRKRDMRLRSERDESKSATEVITTMRKGSALINDDAGTGIVTAI